MYAEERHKAIAELVASRGRVAVTELATHFDVTTETVRRDLSVAIDEAHAEIVHDGLPAVTGDAAQLRVVFQNLIANAVKFRAPERAPHVEIVAARDERDQTFQQRAAG